MGFSRLAITHRLALTYAKDYAAAFGPLPAFDDTTRFPGAGKPGDPAWDQMDPADQDIVNRVAANLGKALEAYERKLATGPAPFDAYLAHQADAMSAGQERGMVAFVELGCAGCHAGPSFTDEKFHNLGVPAWSGVDIDPGREGALAILEANPFNLGGPYADGHPDFVVPTPSPSDLGAFRTPSLRNVALSAPYGHNGRFATLADMIAFHLGGGGRGQSGFAGEVDPAIVPKSASAATIADIVEFLSALNGAYPPAPWNNWPGKN
jgi:cytochrome c peroxidase